MALIPLSANVKELMTRHFLTLREFLPCAQLFYHVVCCSTSTTNLEKTMNNHKELMPDSATDIESRLSFSDDGTKLFVTQPLLKISREENNPIPDNPLSPHTTTK